MLKLKENSVLIREFTEADIDNKVKWINNEENNKYLHYELPLCKEKTLNWFLNKASNRIDCVMEFDEEPVGLIGLIGIDNINKKAEFYISMGRTDFKRKGIATIATKLLLDYAFDVLNLNKVFLNVDEKNLAARNLYEKIGFKIEGFFVNDIIHNGEFINRCRYAIMSNDFMR